MRRHDMIMDNRSVPLPVKDDSTGRNPNIVQVATDSVNIHAPLERDLGCIGNIATPVVREHAFLLYGIRPNGPRCVPRDRPEPLDVRCAHDALCAVCVARCCGDGRTVASGLTGLQAGTET
jgi:hypothetical protein